MKKKNNKKMNKASVSIIAILALLLGVNYQDVYNFVNDNIVASVFEKKEEVISNPFENSNKPTTEKSEDVSVVNSVEEIHLDDETKDIKSMASEPVKSFDELMNENKQLTGIIDPTKVTKVDNNEVKARKKEEPSITVDTSAKVIPDGDVSDDAFFDDFFEE